MKYIIGFLIGIVFLMLGWYVVIDSPRTVKEYTLLSNKYDSILSAKIQIDTVVDTIYKKITKEKPVPYKVTDTIWEDNPTQAYWYFDTIRDTIVEVRTAILSFGPVVHYDIEWLIERPTIVKNTISYVDREVIRDVWFPKRHLYLGANLGSDITYYSFDATYLTKKQLGFKLSYVNWGGDNIWTGGVVIKIF